MASQHVAVFGPTGRVGSQVVAADATDRHSVEQALRDASDITVVVMAVGTDPLKPSTVVTDSVRAIVAAMEAIGLKRYLGVSGTANMPATRLGALSLIPVRRFIKASTDHASAYEIVRNSHLDYVLAACPYIRDGKPAPKGYHEETGPFPGGFKIITPTEVADFLVHQIDDTSHHRQLIGIWH